VRDAAVPPRSVAWLGAGVIADRHLRATGGGVDVIRALCAVGRARARARTYARARLSGCN